MKNEVILQLQAAGYWTLKAWAEENNFDPKVASVVIGRYHGVKRNNIPRGDTGRILQKLNETLAKATKKQQPIDSLTKVETDWLNSKEAAIYLRVKEKTLRNWVSRGVIPLVKEPSTGCLRFNKKALDSWLLRGER